MQFIRDVVTATDQKPQNHKKVILPAIISSECQYVILNS